MNHKPYGLTSRCTGADHACLFCLSTRFRPPRELDVRLTGNMIKILPLTFVQIFSISGFSILYNVYGLTFGSVKHFDNAFKFSILLFIFIGFVLLGIGFILLSIVASVIIIFGKCSSDSDMQKIGLD